jgi:hypothetical protein
MMGVLADLYLSRDDEEAVRYDNEPETFKDRGQFRNFTELELSTLWATIKGIEWDVNSLDDFHSVLVRDGGERCINRLPTSMTDDLARLTPEQISIAATKWAATDEMRCDATDVQPIIEGLVRLARIASVQDRKLYFWNCT